MIEKEVYTLEELSKILSVKVRTLREWIKVGKLKAFKYNGNGRYWYVTRAEIKRMLGV